MEFGEDALHSRKGSINIVVLVLLGEIFFIVHQQVETLQ